MKRILDFASELLRRKVVRLVGAYVAVLWLLTQGAADLFPVFGFPDWSLRAFIIGGIALIPILALLSWKYDLMPPQLVRDAHDVAQTNPAKSWAQRRHDNLDAGFVFMKWQGHGNKIEEKRFFQSVTIGRGLDNDIDLTDERVSRHHAVIWAENGAWHIRDLDSANGTYINHSRVTETTQLPPSSELRFHAAGPTISVRVDKPAKTMVS